MFVGGELLAEFRRSGTVVHVEAEQAAVLLDCDGCPAGKGV
jgi:hypothetical protein